VVDIYIYSIKFFKLLLCIGVYGFGLLHLFLTSISVSASCTYMHYDKFYCTFSGYVALTNPDLRYKGRDISVTCCAGP
jgi:hypothetical protein